MKPNDAYRGRLAPSPTGYLHLGHASTFAIAHKRARSQNGTLFLRNEDLDPQRSKAQYVEAFIEDLLWLGLNWDEEPYHQSQRAPLYLDAWQKLKTAGHIYPCTASRRDISELSEEEDTEPLFPKQLRGSTDLALKYSQPNNINWRFQVPDGVGLSFNDINLGPHTFTAGKDFGDFLVWRRDGSPSYELAVVVDDHEMGITEVVRGADLLKSTARQLLIYKALGFIAPEFYHCQLVCDKNGKRLAKRHDSLSLQTLRKRGYSPEEILNKTLPFQPPSE